MNLDQASFLGLIGSGLSIAAFCGLTSIGILFVSLLDRIDGYCARVVVGRVAPKVVPPRLEFSDADPTGTSRRDGSWPRGGDPISSG